MVSPSTKRRAVKLVIETGMGTTAEACRALGLARSSYYRNSAMNLENRNIQKQIVSLSQEHPRYGYRRGGGLVRPAGQGNKPQAGRGGRGPGGGAAGRARRKATRPG